MPPTEINAAEEVPSSGKQRTRLPSTYTTRAKTRAPRALANCLHRDPRLPKCQVYFPCRSALRWGSARLGGVTLCAHR